jgi:hypothetical protein
LPLVFGVIEAVVSASNQEAAARSLILGFPYHPSRGLPFQVPVVINAILGWLDDRRLKQGIWFSGNLTASQFFGAYTLRRRCFRNKDIAARF